MADAATWKKHVATWRASGENDRAKQRIRSMTVRYVVEPEPTTQALLEIYVAVATGARCCGSRLQRRPNRWDAVAARKARSRGTLDPGPLAGRSSATGTLPVGGIPVNITQWSTSPVASQESVTVSPALILVLSASNRTMLFGGGLGDRLGGGVTDTDAGDGDPTPGWSCEQATPIRTAMAIGRMPCGEWRWGPFAFRYRMTAKVARATRAGTPRESSAWRRNATSPG